MKGWAEVRDDSVPVSAPEAPWGTYAPTLPARLVLALSRNSILGRGGARKALLRLFLALHRGPADVALWGTEVRLHPANNLVERKALLRPDVFDAEERGVLRQVMADDGSVFVDIGGNAGLYSLDAALHAGDGAAVLTIEPDQRLMNRFAFNLAQARRLGRFKASLASHTRTVAISDHNGTGMLSAAGDEGARNILAGDEGTAGRAVTLRTLLGVVQETGLTRIDIMKIDVEGHEDMVLPPYLASAPESLWPGLIIIEHLQRESWRPDCIADALQRGYAIIKTTRNNTFLERRVTTRR